MFTIVVRYFCHLSEINTTFPTELTWEALKAKWWWYIRWSLCEACNICV